MSFCCLPRCCQVLVIYPIVLIIERNSPNLSSWTFDDETAFDRFHTSPKVFVAPAGQDAVKPRPPATSSSLAYVSCCVCYHFSLDFYYCAKVELFLLSFAGELWKHKSRPPSTASHHPGVIFWQLDWDLMLFLPSMASLDGRRTSHPWESRFIIWLMQGMPSLSPPAIALNW